MNRNISKKSPGLILLLNILTCGIYQFFWMYTTTEDIKYLTKNDSLPSGLLVVVLSIITCGLYGFYWYYLIGNSIESIYTRNNVISPVKSNKYVWFLILAFILSFCLGIGFVIGAILPLIVQLDINNLLNNYEQTNNNPTDYSQY